MEIKISKGTYNTKDYRVVKEYKTVKPTLKFLKSIGYVYDDLVNTSWSFRGVNYKLNIQ